MFLKKVLLYLSAFIPLYVLLLTKISIQILNHNFEVNVLNTITMVTLSIFSLLGIMGTICSLKAPSTTTINVISSKNITENHFLGYFSLFVLFALTFQIELISMAVVFLCIQIFIGIVYIHNNLFYINPFLNILGFSFYEVTYLTKEGEEQKAVMLFYGKIEQGKEYFATCTPYHFNHMKKPNSRR